MRLDIPTTGGARLFYLRTFADSQAIAAAATAAKRVVVVGAEEGDWILSEAYSLWRLGQTPLAEGAAGGRHGSIRHS